MTPERIVPTALLSSGERSASSQAIRAAAIASAGAKMEGFMLSVPFLNCKAKPPGTSSPEQEGRRWSHLSGEMNDL